ncbi:MAG TPA: hypothetical protein PKA90_16835, partial [Ignavibacteria bacterium]|nr:hypothetical protein [Ignavibacteria bacterium]
MQTFWNTNNGGINFVKNNLGLKRKYQYFALDSMDIFLQSFFQNPDNHIMTLNSNYYRGYGRDPFFTNMLANKRDSIDILKSVTSYTYSYTLFENRSDLLSNPINSEDAYNSSKIILYSNQPSWDITPSNLKSSKEYRIYPLYNPNDHFAYNPDSDASTKLVEENVLNTNNASLKKIIYSYELGNFNQTNGGFDGSFLISSRKIVYPGVSQFDLWNYSYTYKNGNPDQPAIETKETDPFKNYSIRKDSVFYGNYWHKKFNSFFNVDPGLTFSYYYKLNQTIEESIYDSLDNRLSKKTFEYINEDTSSSLGYYKQLKSEKIYSSPSFTSYIETQYEYCKNDTNGFYIFEETGTFPYKEGNLKLIRKNDQETKFFYNPISLSEVNKNTIPETDEPSGIPYLKYKVKYNNGTELNENEKIWDYRFPIRTDNYKINGSFRDTLSSTYKSYTLDGSPSKIIDQNKYITQFIYQPIHRINSITLPGDFSTTPDSVNVIINYKFINDTVIFRSNGWGFYNYLYPANHVLYTQNHRTLDNDYDDCIVFGMDINATNSAYTSRRDAFFALENSDYLLNFDSINFANLKVGIRGFTHPTGTYYTRLIPVDSITNHSLFSCGNQPFTLNYDKSNISVNNASQLINVTPNSSNIFDIKSMIENLNGQGVILKALLVRGDLGPPVHPIPDQTFKMNFTNITTQEEADLWRLNDSPILTVSGKINISDTLYEPIIKGGTIKYYYDDQNHKVNVYSIRNSFYNDHNRIQYTIDGYGNVKQKDIFTSNSDSNTYEYKFNYLNQPAENLDALDQYTQFSYDGLGRLIKTKNADTSSTLNSYSYYDSLEYTFGTVKNVIEKQRFTDEEGNPFDKYFDAVGNLIREVKFVSIPAP